MILMKEVLMEKPLELLFHPIRMRVAVALAGKELTARQLALGMDDVPPATLYRHINRLTAAGILTVVAERRVRGTLEKVYKLNERNAVLGSEEFAAMSKEEHERFFTAFIASVLEDFQRYVRQAEPFAPVVDGLRYSKGPLELSDQEFEELSRGMRELILPYTKNEPAPDRKRRLVATIVVPDPMNWSK
jgi:DNA-binding transcriptional ArsR family regulator